MSVKKLRLIGDFLFAATLGKGLFKYDSNNDKWEVFFKESPNVTDIIGVGKKYYVASLDNGVYVYSNGVFKNILKDISAKCLSSVDGNIWVGTHGSGIIVLNSSDQQI